MRALLCSSFFALAALSSACGAPLDSETIATSEEAILNGADDAKDTAVVGVYDMTLGGVCSGALLAPNLVLTAHHCVAPLVNSGGGEEIDCAKTTFGDADPGDMIFVTTRETFSMSASDYVNVASIHFESASASFCGNDVALLVLDANVASSDAAPLEPRIGDDVTKGDEFSAVGYGITTAGGVDAGTRRRRDGLTVECVGEACGTSSPNEADEWVGDTGVCSGDSGGPALDDTNRVAGVVSRSTSDCTLPIFSDVAARTDWIRTTTLEAAILGGYGPPSWTGVSESPSSGCAVAPEHGRASVALVFASLGLIATARRRKRRS